MVLRSSKRVSSFRRAALAAVAVSSLPLFAAGASAAAVPPYARPTHFTSAAQPEAVTAASCSGLTYWGGPLITKPQAVAVYWGTPSSFVTQNAGAIIKETVASSYIDQLSEYNHGSLQIVRGSYVGAYAITPSVTGKSVSNDQIGPELQKQIDDGNLPQPTFDAAGNSNTVFVIFFAPGISISLTQQGQTAHSCVEFCGFHFGFSFGANKKAVHYAVIPDMGKNSGCSFGCGVGGESVAVGDTISHELAEAITDPDIWKPTPTPGWYDQTCGENGDICAPGSGPMLAAGDPGDGTLDGFSMQKLWSEHNKTCQLNDSSVGVQAGCASNGDCAAPVPICDTTTKSCVGCKANSDCSGDHPTCDTKLEVCVPCASNSDCAAPTPICETNAAAGAAKNGSCVECIANSDCPNAKPVCTSNACAPCGGDSDCSDPANPTCDKNSGACGPTPGSGGGSGGGNGDTTTTTSSGCAVAGGGPVSGAFGGAGVLFGLAALARVKRRRARR